MSVRSEIQLLDPLYGEIVLAHPLTDLLRTPVVQRLRDVRLSNIDSLVMPGISNISRYEHAIGTTYLASRIGFYNRLGREEAWILQASAMLHDATITAFGHLVEEAFNYINNQYDHEMKMSLLLQDPNITELGGIDLQVYLGHEAGIRTWSQKIFKAEAEDCLVEIANALRGKGRFGCCIAGDIDLDNLDNLVRIAFHMGLPVDKDLPVQIAAEIIDTDKNDGIIFSEKSINLIKQWLALRWSVYEHLMLSRNDFVGKVMLIYATILAYTHGKLGLPEYAWILSDRRLIHHLLESKDREISRTVRAWLVHDLWPLADLLWMRGEPPSFASTYAYADVITKAMGRPCFAYRIQDKRVRALKFRIKSGEIIELGYMPDQWLLGVASSKRQDFSAAENLHIRQLACEFFGTDCIGRADERAPEALSLFE
jgi:HD superfamily phosphohydrolase